MTLHKRWAAVALLGATALATPTLAQTAAHPAAAPAIRREVNVRTAPVHAVPDVGESFDASDTDAGLEAREAMGAAPTSETEPSALTDTLNAQYARLRVGLPAESPATAEAEPPASTPAASVALARRVVESAQAFAGYMQRASAVRPDYVDAAGVARALRAAGVYEAGQVQEGAIAYAALAALQDRAFVHAVDELGRDAESRPALAERLASDPRWVLQTPGASPAAIRAARALGRLGVALDGSGAAVKQSAYDIQRSAWSRAAVAAPEATLAEIKARSSRREALADDGGRAMLTSLVQLRRTGDDAGSGRLTPVVARGLTLAALAVLGEAGEEHADRVAVLLSEPSSAQCLKMARLNLYQCLAVAGPNYEDVFCLGQHAMMETARCVADASGWTPPPAVDPVQAAAPAPQAASIMVPVDFAPQAPSAATVSPATDASQPAMQGPAVSGPTLQVAAAGRG